MRRRSSHYSYSRAQEPISAAVRTGAVLALAGVLVMFAGPVGYRFGLLSLPVAEDTLFVWGANLAGIAAVLSMLGLMALLFRRREARRGIGRAVVAILVGVAAFRAGGRLPFRALSPSLHDITTDTQHPPEYVTVPQIHGGAASPPYAGEGLAARQREAYPDIQPLVLMLSKDEAFAKALGTVRDLGWTLVAADGPAGRIEASASTRLFGTTEDVVVRVSKADGGSRVDVRSVSRDREGDRPNNATRVRAILRALHSS